MGTVQGNLEREKTRKYLARKEKIFGSERKSRHEQQHTEEKIRPGMGTSKREKGETTRRHTTFAVPTPTKRTTGWYHSLTTCTVSDAIQCNAMQFKSSQSNQ